MKSILTFQKWTKKMSKIGQSKYSLLTEIFCDDIEKSKEKIFFVKNREYIIEKKKKCDDYINDLCCHEFEEDMIDLTPEKSMKITYCKICEYTK